jgi:hypothetical protein
MTEGITLSQIHPVLDGRNRPIPAPTAFDINTSIQRALVKAIALHGIGLYVYAGEDLPQASTDSANDSEENLPRSTAVVRSAVTKITGQQQVAIQKLVVQVGIDLRRLLSHYGIERLADLPAADFMRVIRSLESKRKAA